MASEAACARKVSYPSRADAQRAADSAGCKLRPYTCSCCNGWHLTSMSKAEVRRLRRDARKRAAWAAMVG